MRTPLGAGAAFARGRWAALPLPGALWADIGSGAARELREVGLALLQVGVPPFLGLIAHIEQQVGVVGELLEPRQPVLVGVEARLQQTERERRHREHLTAPP